MKYDDKADRQIGAQIKKSRIERGMSQPKLADLAGPYSFQQLQRYERGEGRIPASRLFRIALVLNVSILCFFDTPKAAAAAATLPPFVFTPLGARIMRSAMSLSEGKQRMLLRLSHALKKNGTP